MNKSILQLFMVIATALLITPVAFSAPQYTTFGALPALTAGGSINQSVAINDTLGGRLTLGLTAQQRFFNPTVTNNGAGTFFATTGSNNGLPPSGSAFQGATWNFDFFIGGSAIGSFTYLITYGLVGSQIYSFAPSLDGDADDFAPNTLQDSQNLMFSNFGGAPNGFAGLFNPNANADYEFTLTAFDGLTAVASSDIVVRVGSGPAAVPDSGSTMMLLGVACSGIAFLRRKFIA